jgi:CASP C terminal
MFRARGGKAGARSAVDAEAGRKTEVKYAGQYERRLDPFSEFQGRAREARKAKMSAADRAMLRIGGAMAGSAWVRLAVAGYLLAMHCLVFLVLLRSAHHRSDVVHAHDLLHARGGAMALGTHDALITAGSG